MYTRATHINKDELALNVFYQYLLGAFALSANGVPSKHHDSSELLAKCMCLTIAECSSSEAA